MDYFVYALIAIPVLAFAYGLMSPSPTKEQLENRDKIKLYKEMQAFRNYLVQTGSAQQLEEFDQMFNRVKNLINEDVQKVLDKGYV